MTVPHFYHWKHGWIPLDHVAALSKAKGNEHGARQYLSASHAAGHAHSSVVSGSFGGGTHERGLQPVAAEHLPRSRNITAAFDPSRRRFGLLDGSGDRNVTASIPESLGEHFHANHYRIVGVETHDGQKKIRVQTPSGSKLFAADGTDRHIVDAPTRPDAPKAAETKAPDVVQTHVIKPSAMYPEKFSVLRPVAPGAKHGIIDRKLGDHIAENNFTVIGHNRKVVSTVDSAGVVRKFRDDGSNIDSPTTGKIPSAKDFKRQDIGGWQHVPASEAVSGIDNGTVGGSIAQNKIKRAYVKGNKRVLIETPLSQQQTGDFLSHVDTALAATGSHTNHPVTFHVPSGNGHFRSSRGGTTLAYVYRGDASRVTVNPSVARGERSTPSDSGGHHMEAANHVHPTVYTLVHELGHVVDNKNQHTSQRTSFQAVGRTHTHYESNNAGHAFFRENITNGLSKYGRSSQPEGYAEAFAHYMLTQHGAVSNAAAERYAERYAWKWR